MKNSKIVKDIFKVANDKILNDIWFSGLSLFSGSEKKNESDSEDSWEISVTSRVLMTKAPSLTMTDRRSWRSNTVVARLKSKDRVSTVEFTVHGAIYANLVTKPCPERSYWGSKRFAHRYQW